MMSNWLHHPWLENFHHRSNFHFHMVVDFQLELKSKLNFLDISKEIWNLLRVNSRGRNFFQKAHFLTRCPLRTRETFAFSSRTSLLMGSCRGQYVVDHVPSAERLGFLQKEKKKKMMRKLFYRVEEKILSLTCLSFHQKICIQIDWSLIFDT